MTQRLGLATFRVNKDPYALLPYVVDWSLWLVTGDTIATSTWIVPSGLTVVLTTHTSTSATVWLSGGTAGLTYACINQIVTAGGLQEMASVGVYMVVSI